MSMTRAAGITTKTSRSYSPVWRVISVIALVPLLSLLMKNQREGRENIPRRGGVILAPNHLSYADWVPDALFLRACGRYPTFTVKASAFEVKGVARLALATGVPVIPVAHWGTHDILPYGTKKPRLFPRRAVRTTAGRPVDLSQWAGQQKSAKALRAATEAIMAEVTALLAQQRGQTPPEVPYTLKN